MPKQDKIITEDELKNRLFNKYGYSIFNSSKARICLFNNSNRIKGHVWDKMIDNKLEEFSIISAIEKKGSFMFNILLPNGKFLDYNKILDTIRQHANTKLIFTASSIRKAFSSSMRASKNDLELYLLAMVKDNLLSIIDSRSKIKHFKIAEQ